MSYDELIQKRDELLDEYNFVAHQENGLEGNVNNNTNGRTGNFCGCFRRR